jgi:hypothetical protein
MIEEGMGKNCNARRHMSLGDLPATRKKPTSKI